MSNPLPVDGLLKVHIVARGVDVRAEDDEGEPPQVHVYLYFWDWHELFDATVAMTKELDDVEIEILIDELKELKKEKERHVKCLAKAAKKINEAVKRSRKYKGPKTTKSLEDLLKSISPAYYDPERKKWVVKSSPRKPPRSSNALGVSVGEVAGPTSGEVRTGGGTGGKGNKEKEVSEE